MKKTNYFHTKKTIVITGGTQGIGKALADLFKEKGHTVIVIARHVLDDETQFMCDVTDSTAVDQTFEEIFKKFGSIDLLINNVGAGLGGAVEMLDYELLDWQIKINLMSAVYCTKAVLSRTPSEKPLRIINVSSIGAFGVQPFRTMYSTSKSALLMFTIGMRQELHNTNVKTCCIVPGDTKTEFGKHHPNDFRTNDRYGKRITLSNDSNISRTEDKKDTRMDVEKSAKLISEIISKKNYRSAAYCVGTKYKLLHALSKIFSTDQITEIVRKMFEPGIK